MIIEKYKAFFIHIPKTGGHTVSEVLGGFHQNRNKKHGRHADPQEYERLYPDKWLTYFTFTFVRNPWDRIISYFSRKWGDIQNNAIFDIERNRIQKAIHDHAAGKLGNKLHLYPQVYWLLDEQKNPYSIDYIGKVENFQEDFNKILVHIGHKPYDEFRKTFASSRRDYHEYYDDETMQIVANLYKDDIEYLRYTY